MALVLAVLVAAGGCSVQDAHSPPADGAAAPASVAIAQTRLKPYSTAGKARSLGLNVKLEIPATWAVKKSKQPHTVLELSNPTTPHYLLMLNIQPLRTPWRVRRSDAEDFARADNAVNLFPGSWSIEHATSVVVDGWPALLVRVHFTRGPVAESMRVQELIINHHLVTLALTGAGPKQDGWGALDRQLRRYAPLFGRVRDSIQLPAQGQPKAAP